MAMLISAFEMSKSFGAKTLFEDITFSIEEGQKIGLLGPNGAGKSTLLQILAKKQTQDAGKISFANHLRLGYLEQVPKFQKNQTIIETLLEATGDPDDYMSMALCYELISKLDLDNPAAGSEKNVMELSGGWKKRVALARELAKRPNLLLLDEPTNHLDLESIQWVEEFMEQQHELAVLSVTHDRLFLQNTCDHIFDLDPKNPDGIIKFTGTYADFMDVKDSLLNAQKTLEDAQRNVLRRETAWLRRGAKARQTKQKARIDRAHDLKDEVYDLKQKNDQRQIQIGFAEDIRNPQKIIEAKNITMEVPTQDGGTKTLFKDFSFILRPQSRIGILGKNGCGKSTLIKALLGQLQPTSGSVWLSDKVSYSYFEQLRETLEPNKSVLQNICPDGDYVIAQGKPIFARAYLARFHFRPEQVDMPVAKLSGGEQSRLRLAQILTRSDSVLILDEPTNDLDIQTLDILQNALSQFQGAVIIVTHDRYFMDQVANQLLVFTPNEGEILTFADYFQYQNWLKESQTKSKGTSNQKAAASTPAAAAAPTPTNTPAKKKEKLSYKEQREFDTMEARLQEEEAKLEKFKNDLQDPQFSTNFPKLQELSDGFQKQKTLVDELYKRWEVLTEKQQ